MRGRANACGVALAGYLVPLLSQSTIGLVTLKKGFVEGLVVSLWALLPILLGWFVSDLDAHGANRLLTLVSSFSLIIVVVAAQILRVTISWQWTLIVVVLASVGATLSLVVFAPQGLEQLTPIVMSLLTGGANSELSKDILDPELFVLSMLAWGLVVTAVTSLIISRWWQAMVYNPGGFVKEFHRLRLDARVAQVIVALGVVGFFLYSEHILWIQLILVPLLVSGIALAHHSAAALNLNTSFLILMYIGLFMFSPAFALILICLGFVDSQLDLRFKLADMNDLES